MKNKIFTTLSSKFSNFHEIAYNIFNIFFERTVLPLHNCLFTCCIQIFADHTIFVVVFNNAIVSGCEKLPKYPSRSHR
jgi:hypothetical protein